jgi:hypothetical protein
MRGQYEQYRRDPFVPDFSRLPLSSPGGAVDEIDDSTGLPELRPFGLQYGISPIQAAKHRKEPTRETIKEATEYTDDSKIKHDEISKVQYD